MAGVIEKQAKRWTYEEYYKLDEDQRYEIIDGNLLKPHTLRRLQAHRLHR
jgi:hypothetical protein